MSTFNINEPTTSWSTKLAISSTDTYDREHKAAGSMPLLILAPAGKDRSLINKLVNPATCLVFLNIKVDSVASQLRLPADKLARVQQLTTSGEAGRHAGGRT